MEITTISDGPLSRYRILDLTDEKGFLCGKVLADLGAEVILVEPPGGSPARHREIISQSLNNQHESFFWMAFNAEKRSVILNLSITEGKQRFLALARTADAIIESFSPHRLDELGLGYEELYRVNPSIVLTSITPFGQTGPYSSFYASDIVSMALGGLMHITGDPDRRPLCIGPPQSYLHGALHAAVGTLIALHARNRTGIGQRVDVSFHEAIARTLTHDLPMWEYAGELTARCGGGHYQGKLAFREIWPCADGAVAFRLVGGTGGRRIGYLVNWMRQEGMAGALGSIDWEKLNLGAISTSDLEEWEKIFEKFFLHHSKTELYAQALLKGFPLCPVNTIPEVMTNVQLMFRQFWTFLNHPEMKLSIPYSGAPYRFGGISAGPRCSSPLPGEHTKMIFKDLEDHVAYNTMPGKSVTEALPYHQLALGDLKVLDLTHQLAGPLITKYLADFGATVIKVESSYKPDITRITAPFKDNIVGLDRTGNFVNYNTNKLSLGLNLDKDEAKPLIANLVRWADVMVENYGPGTINKWGLEYTKVKELNPRIVFLSSSAQGQGGPVSMAPGYGWNLNGLTGFTEVVGWPDRPSVSPHVAYTDVITPWYGVMAVLAVLEYRRCTGQGQYIDLSQLEAGLTFLAPILLDYAMTGRVPYRQGNRSPAYVPNNVYPCRGLDRWCAISVSDSQEWQALVKAMGNPDWCRDTRFQKLSSRRDNEDELDALVSSWTLNYEPRELMLLLQSVGVPAGIVQNPADIWNDPQLKYRKYFVTQPHREMRQCTFQGWPVKLSRNPVMPGSAPCLGEHTEHICSTILGLSDNEFASLLNSGVVEIG